MKPIATAPATAAPTFRSLLLFLLKAGIAGVLLVALCRHGLLDFGPITSQPRTLRFLVLLGAGGLFALGALMVLGWRLVLLLSVQGISISYARAFVITVVCNLISAVLPGIIAGDVTKLAYLCRSAPQQRRGAAAAVLLDRAIGLYGLLLLGSLSAAFAVVAQMPIRRNLLSLAAAGALLGTLGLAALLELSRRSRLPSENARGLFPLLRRLINAVGAYRKQPRTLFYAVGLSVASHAMTVGTFICSAAAMRDSLGPAVHFVLDPLAMLLNAVPLSPGGLGLAEGAFSFLFSGAGSPNGALVGLTGRLLLYAVSLCIVVIAFVIPNKLSRTDSAGDLEARTT